MQAMRKGKDAVILGITRQSLFLNYDTDHGKKYDQVFSSSFRCFFKFLAFTVDNPPSIKSSHVENRHATINIRVR